MFYYVPFYFRLDLSNYLDHLSSDNYYKNKLVQTVEFKAEDGEYWLPIFKRKGKKIQIDRELLNVLTVGTINSLFQNTELYDQTQYKLNGAKTWADLAYGKNEVETVK